MSNANIKLNIGSFVIILLLLNIFTAFMIQSNNTNNQIDYLTTGGTGIYTLFLNSQLTFKQANAQTDDYVTEESIKSIQDNSDGATGFDSFIDSLIAGKTWLGYIVKYFAITGIAMFSITAFVITLPSEYIIWGIITIMPFYAYLMYLIAQLVISNSRTG